MALLKRYPRLWLVLPVLLIFVAGVALKLGSQPVAPVVSAPLPLYLTHQHVGQHGHRNENAQAGGMDAYSVTASSGDIWGTADSFRYGYQELNGNGQIVARVLGMEGTANGWAKAGVMIRETLDPHSRHAALVGTVGNGVAFQWRAVTGGASGSTSGSTGAAPCWVKLVRYGNFVLGYESKDGVHWQLVDWQIVEMSRRVYAGVAVSSHDETSACTARFDHVQVSAVKAWDAAPVLGAGDGLRGDYFGNKDLAGTPLMVRKDRTVDFNWDIGAPMELAKPGPFSVRWTGEIQAQFTESYTLYLETDEGVRVWLDGKLVMNDWVNRYDGKSQATVNLVAGQKYPLQIEYYKDQGLSHARMLWSSPSTPKRIVPQSQLYPAANTPAASPPTTSKAAVNLPTASALVINAASVNTLAPNTSAADVNFIEEPEEDPMLPWAVAPSSPLNGVWNHCDIGSSAGGGAVVSNGMFTVTGYGSDIWNQADDFHYVYQPLTGDGQIVTRVLGMAGAHPWAKAGLMIRETLEAGSKHATLACTLANGLGYFWRVSGNNDTYYSAANRLDTPCWLKLVRKGDLLGGFVSTDGVNWQLADWERVTMGQKVYIGMAVSSHDDQGLCTAWFDQVKVSAVDAPNPLPVIGTGDGLKGDYFANMNLGGALALSQVDPVVQFDWGEHAPTGLPSPDYFSIRWTGEIQAKYTEPCTFYLYSDDGVRAWLNDQLIINKWVNQYEGESTATVNLTAGKRYLLRIEYYQNRSQAHARFMWSSPSLSQQIVPQSQLYSQPTLDPDGSGLPVIWEMIHFGHTGVDPNADPDGDGLSNLQEYQHFTDPLNPDSSGSGIPDGWLIANGLDLLDPNIATEDPDQDGLSNLQEYQAGTDPNNPCSRIAAVPDNVTVLYLRTNSATLTTVASANGAQGQAVLGRWQTNGTALYALDRRGEVQFTLAMGNADKLLLEVDGTQNQTGSPCSTFDLILYLDGECLGHRTLKAGYGTNGMVVCLAPYLKAGQHTVQVFWDGSASFSSLRLQQIRLRSIDGVDSDGDGIKDWVERALNAESGHDGDISAGSYVSPAFIEGCEPDLSLMSITAGGNAVPVSPNAGLRWYANVPLSAQTNTPVSIFYQNGGLVEFPILRWLPLDILSSTNLLVRTGDSLLLTAGSNQTASLQITVLNGSKTVATYNTTAAQPVPCQFSTAGTYTINAVCTPQAGAAQTGSITVKAVGYNFPASPASPVCLTSVIRNWPLTNVPPEIVLATDQRLKMVQTNPASLSLQIDQNLPRTLVARLGNAGPILASATARGLRLFAAPDTYNTVITNYPDGSQLVETMDILSPVRPDVTVEIHIIVGGVTFDDGTTVKVLTPMDFDALGQYKVRFLMPAGVQTANCHGIRVMQGTSLVGDYY